MVLKMLCSSRQYMSISELVEPMKDAVVLLVTMNYSGVIGHNELHWCYWSHCITVVLLVTMNYSGVIGHNELQWCYWSQ